MTLTADVRGELLYGEPMSRHTSWRVGGPAELYFRPASLTDLSTFLAQIDPEMPVTWLGLGSNLLVRDGGLRGVVIATHGVLNELRHSGNGSVYAQAGVACARIARQCAKWGLGPAEFFAGIPGTLGGALAMNAGAFGGETWEHVVAVETIHRGGGIRRRERHEFRVGYRSVRGPQDEWFVAAELHFEPRPEVSMEAIREVLARRKATQPIGLPSCGSVFRNPPGDHAARLIEQAGLKGRRMGGAVVSEKHANFIINTGNATAADMEALIGEIRATVRARYGVELVPEVRIVGEEA
jgi:UDP-N-acetylmuramate dehydrogenase